jgi:late competence protein required for DNA uptake (superfamily II DNA/RNA helicase)
VDNHTLHFTMYSEKESIYMSKFQAKFVCYWCKTQLTEGEQLTEINGNFYCKNCDNE